MALPTSGTLRLSQVIAYFGGGNSLRDFLRGGAEVPNIPENSGVPSSGNISLRDLLGATNVEAVSISLPNASVTDNTSPMTAGVTANPTVSGGSGTKSYTWARVSGDSRLVITNSTSRTPTFTPNTQADGTYSAVWRVTVTDDSGSDSDDGTMTVIYDSPAAPLTVSVGGDSAVDSTSPYYVEATAGAAASGGSGTKTYAWTLVSGSGLHVVGGTTGTTLTVAADSSGPGSWQEVWRCTVTDSSGSASDTGTLSITHGTI